MALDEAERILAFELNPEHKFFGFLLGRKVAVTTAILTATARVTPGRLRGAEQDNMSEILEAVQKERAKLSGLH